MNGSQEDSRHRVVVKGTVQGVGFRPFVYNLAVSLGLKGFVINTPAGVEIEVEGENYPLFLKKIKTDAPPLSDILSIDATPLPPAHYSSFEIRASDPGGAITAFIPPDIAVCRECMLEIYEVSCRRRHYPFTNCTNCGPRYTITMAIPYDRKNTTMSVFRMCPDCEREYNDPRDRRFHAQPIACPECGPQLELRVRNAECGVDGKENPIESTIAFLKQGKIVGIKGIGGFHIACDAENDEAVRLLRERKRRGGKPFAIMCPDIGTAERFGCVDDASRSFLLSPESPAVLLRKKESSSLSASVSPFNAYVGIMLPYTPLHHLMFFHPGCERPNFSALVMTSGNISEEPIIRDNDEAVLKLGSLCDAFLLHNRDIRTRVDDSVVAVIDSRPSLVRRSRGYAPRPLRLPFSAPPLLATGAELKSAFTLAKGCSAIVSQHLGDLDSRETLLFFEETLANLKGVFRIEPEYVVHDLHPDYLSTRWAREQALSAFAVQHHEAHIASCIAENGVEGKVVGIALDGTGYGRDNAIWGGEIFTGSLEGFKRAAHFQYVPMPGGEAAVREPWRMAASFLNSSTRNNLGYIMERWGDRGAETVIKMAEKGVNSPLTSSCGRLFDAAASIICGFDTASFEAEAAMALESLVRSDLPETYPYAIMDAKGTLVVDFRNTLEEIARDIKAGKDRRVAATMFHNTIARGVADAAVRTASNASLSTVCLSGGVFQNRVFTEMLIKKIIDNGLKVVTHRLLPPNDGGISFGQAALGGWRKRCV